MSAAGQTDPAALRGATVSLPASVVFRALAAETVMLDLRTGRYHHLDPRTGQAVAAVEAELCALCLSLAERGLLDVRAAGAS